MPRENYLHRVVIAQRDERKALDEATHLAGHVAEIYRRAKEQHVRGQHALQHAAQGVLVITAAAFGALALAGEAAYAAAVIQVVEVYKLGLGSGFPCAVQRGVQQRSGVPVFPRAAVDCNGLHDYTSSVKN